VKTIINSIEIKVGELIAKYNKIQLEKSDLQTNNNALNVKLQEQEDQILALQDKVKLINISKSVDGTKDDVKATRLKINEYVREIDKCIALLNE
jgi:predicted  nucleic acid-binding Zn-ribbon protein|tara:strand:- start:223 stop:504 length:282 start_codon:yes stop_codon:yes gene_type:complete